MELTEVLRRLEKNAARTVKSCIGRFAYPHDVFIPDAAGCYPLYWQRDFGYAFEYMPECFETGMVTACCEDILANARPSDGWMPDRFYPDGNVFFSAGGPERSCGFDCLDTAAFITRTVYFAVNRLGALTDDGKAFYLRWRSVLSRALNAVPLDNDTGLVYNDPMFPHTVFGFTDTVCKTGLLCMESLDMWRAFRCMAELDDRYRLGTGEFMLAAKKLEASLEATFFRGELLDSATIDCAQPDIWASAYAVSQGFPLSEDAKAAISDSIARDFDRVIWRGYARHNPEGTTWQRFHAGFMPADGEYMNGAYWPISSGWIAEALYTRHPELSERIFRELAAFADEEGFWECANKNGYRKVANYGASASNIIGSARKLYGADYSDK